MLANHIERDCARFLLCLTEKPLRFLTVFLAFPCSLAVRVRVLRALRMVTDSSTLHSCREGVPAPGVRIFALHLQRATGPLLLLGALRCLAHSATYSP